MTTIRFIPPGAVVPDDAAEVRSEQNRALLVHVSAASGVVAFERRAHTRHLLSWEALLALPGVRDRLLRLLASEGERAGCESMAV